MKIWLIAENWPPRVGGIENYLTNIAKHLPKGSVRVFVPKFVQYIKPTWLIFFIAITARALFAKPDTIICGKALVEGRIALLLKKIFGIPYVVCTYGMEIATWSANDHTQNQLKNVLKKADSVLYINNQTKAQLLELGADEQKLSALYPGIDTEALSNMSNPEEVLRKYEISKPYILTVARLVKRKGTDDLLRAFARLKNTFVIPASEPESTSLGSRVVARDDNTALIIVGDGPEKNNLENLAKNLKAPVRFLGHIPDEDLHALYAHATIFALTPKELPGDYEGFGIVYLEAAFFGLPVVGTKTGGVSEAVEDGDTGILAKPGDISSIANAITKLLSTQNLAQQYGEAGRKRVIDKFQWKTTIQKLESILKHL